VGISLNLQLGYSWWQSELIFEVRGQGQQDQIRQKSTLGVLELMGSKLKLTGIFCQRHTDRQFAVEGQLVIVLMLFSSWLLLSL